MLGQKLSAGKREIKNRGYLNQLKRNGQVPAIVYGKGEESISITLQQRQLNRVFSLHGSRGIFSLEIEGESKPVMALIREIQRNPVSGQLIHLDFLTVSLDEKINSNVGILLNGEEEIMKKGGILQSGLKEVEVLCFPQDLPEYLAADISSLEIGDVLHAADLALPAGVEILSDMDSVIASVLAPSKASAADEEEGEEGGVGEEDEEKPE